MKPPDWDRIREIYDAAMALPREERSAFVAKACAGDPDLLREVMSLLAAADSLSDFLESPVFKLNPAPDSLVGTTIGERYFVERELHPGGMSRVYVALDLNLQRDRVVVKVLSSELVQDSYARQKFEQEIEALIRIKHPNVVRVRDSSRLPDGKPYIVMDYVEGETLRSQITSDGMDLKRAASILQQIGAALGHIHERGIFHRDLKPENVMLTSGNDSVVLLDFGIAKVKDSLVGATTVNDVFPGTLAYMSPEQLRRQEITAASDIYSMGVLAYEMVCGERPFDPASSPDLLQLQRKGARQLPKHVPAQARHMIRRALSFDPQNRNRNAREFGDKLARALLYTPGPLIPTLAKVLGGIIIVALVFYGLTWIIDGKREPNRTFSYFLMVQKVRDGALFKSNGDEDIFENGDKFQLNVLTPVPAYLYVFNEGPSDSGETNFRMIYPNPGKNGGAASLGANQPFQSEWMTFHGAPGDENFWFVWSLTEVPQLEPVKAEAFNHPRGGLTDQNLVAVKEFLRTQPLATVYHYKADQTAKPRGKGDMLVALAQFKHR
jgi:serine/threonine protein kinase